MSALTRFLGKRNQKARMEGEKQGKLYRLVTNISIFGVFIAIALVVLGFAKIIKLNYFMFGVIATIAIISIACLLLLPWVRWYEKRENKTIPIVFIIFVAVCAVLWLICVYMGIGLYRKAVADTAESGSIYSMLKFVKIVLIVSFQLLIASMIANTVMRYGKKMIAFQAITYASNLFFDFYITYLLACVTINNDGFAIDEGIKLLGNKIMIVLVILSFLYMIISSKIMQNIEERRFKNAVEDSYDIDGEARKEVSQTEDGVEARLEKLKNMLDKNLITQEEYDKKKEDILSDM